MSSQPPGDEGNSREFRLIEGGAVPDNVVRARTWCEAHPGTLIVFEDGWYSCLREGEVIASSITLAALLDKLQGMFPTREPGRHEPAAASGVDGCQATSRRDGPNLRVALAGDQRLHHRPPGLGQTLEATEAAAGQ